ETWFRVGDRDAATHLIRTNMLKNGKNLSDITKWMCEKFAVSANIIPVTDNSIETRIITDKGELHLQEYWVKHRGKDPVEGIQYIGADKARPNPEAVNAIHDADLVILAPGNPLTSIGPMLQIKGIRKELSKIKKKVVAISPLIGDNAISGPAAKYMQAAGIESNAYGLAKMYSDVCSKMIIDTKDRMLSKKIQSLDMKVFETKITMKNKLAEDALANFILKQVHI
ncbi:2-phospho-L-lactate transferase protein, partial [Marine Group I thaumarchaeote SCGC AAA799-D11]